MIRSSAAGVFFAVSSVVVCEGSALAQPAPASHAPPPASAAPPASMPPATPSPAAPSPAAPDRAAASPAAPDRAAPPPPDRAVPPSPDRAVPPPAVPQIASPGSVPAPTPEEIRRRRVPVDVESTRPAAVLERRVTLTENEGSYAFLPYQTSSSTWEQVCVTPCQVDLDRFSTYRVAARNGTSPSRSFTLPQGPGAMRLDVDSGDLTGHRAGAALAGTGFAAAIVGVGLIAAQGVFTNEERARTAGFITGGAGLVLMAVGIPLYLATQTSVSSGGAKVASAPGRWTF